jgi:hypothetical protein
MSDETYPHTESNANRLIRAAVDSYDKHCSDPIAAAEGDLLGEAVAVLEIIVKKHGRAIEIMRENNLAITDHSDPMQKLAFTFYTKLAELSEEARAVLKKVKP